MVEPADVPTVNSLLRIETCVSDWESNLFLKSWQKMNPTEDQKKEAGNKAIESHHSILFICGANKNKYGKRIEEMKNDIHKKYEPFPKSVANPSMPRKKATHTHIINKHKCTYRVH